MAVNSVAIAVLLLSFLVMISLPGLREIQAKKRAA